MRGVLEGRFDVDESSTREEALELIDQIGNFDVAIVDMRWQANKGAAPTLSGNEAIRALRRLSPSLGIVAYGEKAERQTATAAMQAGASAYLARTAQASILSEAAEAALAQETFIDPAVPPRGSRGKLTRRQRQIIQCLADGASTTGAARELDLSEETVKTHTKNIMARLGARNRTHAVAIAMRESLID